MRNRFQELDDAIQDLVEREEPPILLVALPDLQAIYLAKSIEGRDQQDPANVYLLFPQPVPQSASAYVDSLLAQLKTQIELANATRIVAGASSWPELPPAFATTRLPPAARLEEALLFARNLIDAPDENKLVCVFCPSEISSPLTYKASLERLLPIEGRPASPFFAKGKLIVRDTPGHELIAAFRAEKSSLAMTYEPDLSPEAVAQDMAETAADPGTPEAQRMECLLQLAGLDLAHQRFEEAIAKYELLYDYYTRYEAHQMRAIVLAGVGDILRHAKSPAKAREKYAQALSLALDTKTLPLIAGTATQVGDMSFELADWDDALGHFELARSAADKLINRTMMADLDERIGDVQVLKKDLGKAVVAWRRAAEVAHDVGYTERQRRALEKLSAAYSSAEMKKEYAACQAELAALAATLPATSLPSAAAPEQPS